MAIILAVISIGVGLFVLIFTLAGARNDATLWAIGIGFAGFGIATLVLKIRQENQRQAAIKAREDERRGIIRTREGEWGKDVCESLIARQIQLEMTQEMVQLAWGRPSSIDEKEVTQKNTKERWIYGQPRRGANYVWFTNGKVSKIKT